MFHDPATVRLMFGTAEDLQVLLLLIVSEKLADSCAILVAKYFEYHIYL